MPEETSVRSSFLTSASECPVSGRIWARTEKHPTISGIINILRIDPSTPLRLILTRAGLSLSCSGSERSPPKKKSRCTPVQNPYPYATKIIVA